MKASQQLRGRRSEGMTPELAAPAAKTAAKASAKTPAKAARQASVGDSDFSLEDACGGARRRRGLPVPKVIVPVDEIRNGKPDPEGFLFAARRLGVPPEECLVFENTRSGIETEINAGMQVVGIFDHYAC
jgi:hypothetical protein